MFKSLHWGKGPCGSSCWPQGRKPSGGAGERGRAREGAGDRTEPPHPAPRKPWEGGRREEGGPDMGMGKRLLLPHAQLRSPSRQPDLSSSGTLGGTMRTLSGVPGIAPPLSLSGLSCPHFRPPFPGGGPFSRASSTLHGRGLGSF